MTIDVLKLIVAEVLSVVRLFLQHLCLKVHLQLVADLLRLQGFYIKGAMLLESLKVLL